MTEVLERDSAVPLYAQLEQILSGKISSGQWQPNQRIPSENELNRMYGLSRMTVRGVLTKLVNDGLLLRVPGKGTYVAPTKISAVSPAYRGIREQLEALGYSTTTRLVSFEREAATSLARDRLGLARGAEVYVIVRVRSVQAKGDVAQHPLPRQQAISLEDDRALRRDLHPSAVGPVKTGEQPEEGALAAAGGAQQDHQLLVGDGEVQVVEDDPVPEPADDLLDNGSGLPAGTCAVRGNRGAHAAS